MNHPIKILLYEDDPDTTILLKMLLTSRGFELVNYDEVDNYKNDILLNQPDVIIMDLRIPKIGGAEVTASIKSDEKLKNIPVILYSADLQVEQIGKEVKADAIVKKPFDIHELVKIINDQAQKKTD
ncbi:MAG: response regulator [Cyclobacteriaceae bacterium]